MNKLPSFLVIGARKSATSSLHDILSRHSDICMSRPKETCFFSHQRPYARGLDWYRSLFHEPEREFWGESSVDYGVPTQYTNVIPRIKRDLPSSTRFIFIARNPLERIESEWKMHYPVGWYGTKPFERVLFEDGLVETSMYFQQMCEYIHAFGRDRLHVEFFEDFVEDPRRVVDSCLKFIGADVSKISNEFEVPHALNSSQRHIHRHPWIGRLSRSAFFRAWSAKIPTRFREFGRSLLKSRKPLVVPWTPALKSQVIAKLAVDSQAFLKEFGKPLDFWSQPRRQEKSAR